MPRSLSPCLALTAALAWGAAPPARAAGARESSRSLRAEKHVLLAGEPPDGAFSLYPPMAPFGVLAGLYLNEQEILEASVVGSNISSGYAAETASVTNVRFRQFLGNSFFVAAGGAVRTLAFDWYQNNAQQTSMDRSDANHSAFKRTDIGGTFSLGNMWQGRAFTWGFDWIGVYARFRTLTEERTYAAAADQGFVDKNHGAYVGSPDEPIMVMLTRAYFGVSF